MGKRRYRYIYGPVPSWRLGSSLGVDPISRKNKICSFDCIYCQLGRTTRYTAKRRVFVPVRAVVREIISLPPIKIDYITFSGRGEPTLAKNLGGMIAAVKRMRKEPVAVITNASLMWKKEVREDLARADLVMVKLDAHSEGLFRKVNRPGKGISFAKALGGIRKFAKDYRGKLAVQIMFVEDNAGQAGGIASLVRGIHADEVQLNTPLRPCAVKPLSRKRMKEIEKRFRGMNTVMVYAGRRKKVKPVSRKDTLRRRGKV